MSEAPLTTRLHWGTAHCPQGPCILYVIMTVWHIGGWEWGFIWILGVRQLIELDFLFYEKINRNFSAFSQLLWIALCTSWGGEVFPSWRSLLVITCVDNLKTCLLRSVMLVNISALQQSQSTCSCIFITTISLLTSSVLGYFISFGHINTQGIHFSQMLLCVNRFTFYLSKCIFELTCFEQLNY